MTHTAIHCPDCPRALFVDHAAPLESIRAAARHLLDRHPRHYPTPGDAVRALAADVDRILNGGHS